MSAYICDDCHISALAAYAVRERLWKNQRPGWERTDAEALAELLHAENVKSVNARYESSDEPAFKFCWKAADRRLSPVQLIKAAHCFAYQACEHEGWEKSEAHGVIHAIEQHALRDVPGYEQAAWGIPECHR